jgi:hypothetical protein
MTLSSNPAPARSELTADHPAAVRADPPAGHPAGGAASARRHPFVVHGALLSAGALAWSASIVALGVDPVGNPNELLLFGLGSGLFQLGLLALLRVLWRTRALGEGRIARAALIVESVLVTFAIGSTLADAFAVSDLNQPVWAALDAFWPLSMLGMVFIGIRVAVAGRWTGVTRFWPLVAESWAAVVLPINGIFGGAVSQNVAAAHLIVGYAVLGVLVARKTG